MKKYIEIIIISIFMLVLGLGLGYFFFNKGGASHLHENAELSTKAIDESAIWTCSMHPQIRQNEPGLCPICEMDLIPQESSSVSQDPLVLNMTEEAVKLSNIQTTSIGSQQTAGKSLQLNGTIKADERRTASLTAHIPGRIEKLYVSFTGEQINKGQKLADIYSPDLITAQRELLEAKKMNDISPALLEASRNKLKFWKINVEQIDQILNSGKIRETFPVYAESSGVVLNKRVTVGDYIQRGQALFTIQDLNRLWVLFDVYEDDLPLIKIGSKLRFTIAGEPGKTYISYINFINPGIDPDTRVATVRGEISNTNRKLKPEMFVKGELEFQKTSSEQLLVPKSAVMWTGKRSVAYIKLPDLEIPSYEYREIEIGESVADAYVVLNGLESGDEVVSNGAFVIDAAAQLNNQKSMMNRKVSVKKTDLQAKPNFHESTPSQFKDQLTMLIEPYLQMKDAFVNTDAGMAKESSIDLLNRLPEIDMNLLQGDPHIFWMEQLNALKTHLLNIGEFEDIEKQRKQFEFVSDAFMSTVEAFGVLGDTLYFQYCPMAFDNKGASWISDQAMIRNPYFGDKMLKCGSVTDTIYSD